VLERLDGASARLARACEDGDLPERSDAAVVDAFLVSVYRRAWEAGLTA
jgi:hypothetical protein